MIRSAAVAAAVAATAALAACSAPPPSPRARALAYMHAHPVLPPAGMVAGIVWRLTDLGDQGGTTRGWLPGVDGEKVHPVRCPSDAMLGAAFRGPAGRPVVQTVAATEPDRGLPACDTWRVTLLTTSGRMVTASCGGPGQPCPTYPPLQGDYVSVPSGGQIMGSGDLRTIQSQAVDG